MIFPTIHLNGTAKEDLLEAIEQAYKAILEAQQKLAQTAPNGRDYYPQGPQAIHDATNEHWARVQKLTDIKNELGALAENHDRQERIDRQLNVIAELKEQLKNAERGLEEIRNGGGQ